MALAVVSQAVFAEKATNKTQYAITFFDETSKQNVNEARKWILENGGEVVDVIYESFAKLIVAKMDDRIHSLNTTKPGIIESIDEDNISSWGDKDEL